ncbi:MAG: hypothetical protein DRO18_05835 [Thermoprotei archaeon]|nr:MAG: hypothetical protein DRO18_05835 [Thermoprotei archaeon]
MCRMLALIWESREGLEIVKKLMELLVKSSLDDPLLKDLHPDRRHCHGYGYFTFYLESNTWNMLWGKGDSADVLGLDEKSCIENLERLNQLVKHLNNILSNSQKGLILLHSRRAGKEPRGLAQAHPFIYIISSRNYQRIIALIGNGSVSKDSLALYLGLDPTSYSDTNILTTWIGRQLGYGRSLTEVISELKKLIPKALNIAVSDVRYGVKDINVMLHVYSYIIEGLDEKVYEYYKPVIVDLEHVKGFVSSSIDLLAKREGLDLKGYVVIDELKTFSL